MKPGKREVVYNANTRSSIFYQDKQPITLNKLRENLKVIEVVS